jgi:hypothetical protein
MLAATDRQEIGIPDGSLSRQLPQPVFKAAYRELCTRIWIELELLAQAAREIAGRQRQSLLMSTVILRLELTVLIDSCRSAHWRRMLTAERCDQLCSMLTDVLAALDVESDELDAGIADAQSRVLDELIPESEPRDCQADPESQGELEDGLNPAFVELMSVIETRAAARG